MIFKKWKVESISVYHYQSFDNINQITKDFYWKASWKPKSSLQIKGNKNIRIKGGHIWVIKDFFGGEQAKEVHNQQY